MSDGIRSCRDFEERLTPYVDGDISQDTRRAADSHLAACPSCRDHVQAERTARDVAAGAARHAARCGARRPSPPLRGAADRGAARPSRLRRWVPLSLAATLLLAVGGRLPLRLELRASKRWPPG